MRNKKEVLSDKPQIFRTMLSVIAALLVYEAGKAAGLMLAGFLFGYGGSTGGMDAGTVNSGLTGGMANLLMTLTGGLACLAVWRSSLNFRLGKSLTGNGFLPLFSWRPPCPWGLTLSSLISVWHSIPRPFSRWQRNRLPYRCGWESACMDLQRLFPRNWYSGELSMGNPKRYSARLLPWYFPAWFSAFTTGTWCRGYMLPCLASCLPG